MINFTNNFIQSDLGLFYKNSKYFLFFGNKKSTLEQIKLSFPNFELLKIRQTHSSKTVEASDNTVEADSHYSSKKNAALLISTADCMPILIYCLQTNRVAAVHAGWKGVENQIIVKALLQLEKTGSDQKKFEIFVGPHLLQESFEIDYDIFLKLKNVYFDSTDKSFYKKINEKYYVDLNKIILSQIRFVTNKDFEINCALIDTKTNNEFWSFRRDKERAGRNLSFIALMP